MAPYGTFIKSLLKIRNKRVPPVGLQAPEAFTMPQLNPHSLGGAAVLGCCCSGVLVAPRGDRRRVATGFVGWWPRPLGTPQDTGAGEQGQCGGAGLLHLQDDPLRHLQRVRNNAKNKTVP